MAEDPDPKATAFNLDASKALASNYIAQLLGASRSASPAPTNLIKPPSTSAGTVPALLSVLPPFPPTAPAQTSYSQVTRAAERFEKRLSLMREAVPVGNGRVVPETEDLTILGARRLNGVAVLFLDICGFSTIDSGDEAEQDRVFTLLGLFMSEMLHDR